MKYSIEQLCQKVNDFVKQSSDGTGTEVSDKRVKDELSIRRIRDYYSKGLMSESIKEGRNAYYDDNHVKQLLALKLLQNEGITENYIKKQINIFDELELDQFLMSKDIVVNDKQVAHVAEAHLNQINNVSIQEQNNVNTNALVSSKLFSTSSDTQSFMAYSENVDSLHNQGHQENLSPTLTSYSNNSIQGSVLNHTENNIGGNINSEKDYEEQQKAMALIHHFKQNQENNLYSKSLSNFKKRSSIDNSLSSYSNSNAQNNTLSVVATEYKEYEIHEDIVLKVKSQSNTQNLTPTQKDDVLQKIKQILNI